MIDIEPFAFEKKIKTLLTNVTKNIKYCDKGIEGGGVYVE